MDTLLPPFTVVVPDAWCDYNRHFSDGYYAVAFSGAADVVLDAAGLGARYRAAGHHSAYTIEAHIHYLREGKAGDRLVIRNAVQRFDAKRLWMRHEMSRGETLLATCEFLYLHVDVRVPRAAPFPPAVLERLRALAPGGELPATGRSPG